MRKEEKVDLFKCTAAILHFGNCKWKQRYFEEKAEPDGTVECEKVAHLLGIDKAGLIKALINPEIKVNFCCLLRYFLNNLDLYFTP